jgi:hypothetical protein
LGYLSDDFFDSFSVVVVFHGVTNQKAPHLPVRVGPRGSRCAKQRN